MGTELLLTGLLILLVIGLLVALVASMVFTFRARNSDAGAKDASEERQFFVASLLNFFNQK